MNGLFNTTMKSIRNVLLIVAAVLLMSADLSPVSAQQPPGFAGGAVPDPSAPAVFPNVPSFVTNSPIWNRRIKELNVDNLPMAEVRKVLTDQFPEVNFINDPSVDLIPVKLSLRSVTLLDIFMAISITTQSQVQANPINEHMVSFSAWQSGDAGGQKKICRAYSLSNYLAGRTPDEANLALAGLEEGLKTCWTMLSQANPRENSEPQLNVHAPTKMLIAVGTEAQLEVIRQFVEQLESPLTIPGMLSGMGSEKESKAAKGAAKPAPASTNKTSSAK